MVPSIAQQLQSLRSTLAETIIPALPADAGFAQEQAGLMVATLDWLGDVHAHAYRYEAAENADYRALLAELATLAGDADVAAIGSALDAPAPPAADALVPLEAITAQTKAMKELAGRLFETLSAESGGDGAERVRALTAQIAQRQGEREAAWFRMTGFPREPGEIGEVLERA